MDPPAAAFGGFELKAAKRRGPAGAAAAAAPGFERESEVAAVDYVTAVSGAGIERSAYAAAAAAAADVAPSAYTLGRVLSSAKKEEKPALVIPLRRSSSPLALSMDLTATASPASVSAFPAVPAAANQSVRAQIWHEVNVSARSAGRTSGGAVKPMVVAVRLLIKANLTVSQTSLSLHQLRRPTQKPLRRWKIERSMHSDQVRRPALGLFCRTTCGTGVDDLTCRDSDSFPPVRTAMTDATELAAEPANAAVVEVVPLLMQNRIPGYDAAKVSELTGDQPTSLVGTAKHACAHGALRLSRRVRIHTLLADLPAFVSTFRQDDKEKYLIDVSLRPEETSMDGYEATPISDFGAACLRGMGWKEGEAIGGTNKGLAEPIVAVPRLQRLGLGATRDQQLQPDKYQKFKPKKYIRPGESREQGQKQMEAARSADGKARHTRGIDEKLVEKEVLAMREGAYVLLTVGPHSGFTGKVRRVRSDRVEVELSLGSEVVSAREDDLRLLEKSEYKHLKRSGRASIKRSSKDDHGSRSSSSNRKRRKEESWLQRSIRVRIISERYKSGRYYNKKVKVVDVITPTSCNCIDDSGNLLEDLRQKELETVVPKKVGGVVSVVLGEHKGRRGKVLERSSKSGTLVVQLGGDQEVRSLVFDQVAEYVGEAYDDDW